jgi:hypothetical protein
MKIDRALFVLTTSAMAAAAFASHAPARADTEWPAAEGGGGAPSLAGCGHSSAAFNPLKQGCNDAAGAPGDCNQMNQGGSCRPFPFPVQACTRWLADYKPGVAARAVACAQRLSAAQYCDACYTYRCGYEALMGSCVDLAAAADCAAIQRACPTVRPDECMGYLSGMSAAGRAKMVQCMSDKTRCGWGLYSCSEGV